MSCSMKWLRASLVTQIILAAYFSGGSLVSTRLLERSTWEATDCTS